MGVTTVIKDYGTSILNAIRDNDLKALRSIFEKHLKSDSKIAELCVTDIKHKPSKKFACPLILAARQEDHSIIKYMMDHGVDPNYVHHTIFTSKRRETVTALHIAVDLGLFSTVEVLLNANADPNIVDHNDETSLHVAVKKADRVMTRMLLAKGADPSALDRRGNAPLHIVTLFGHLQLVKTLLKYDADVYQKGNLGAIPSHIAAREGHIHLIQVFCSRDVGNINVKIPCFSDQREKAPIHLAAENGNVETVLALVDQFSAEVNLRDSDGNTPLHCTVLNPYHPYKMREKEYFYATAKTLIKYRVAINEKNKYGETALHLAAANHYQKIVELLLSVGANPFAENDQHLKPIDVVPEADPVTKQLLKNAMTNPRPAPLSASMLSLQRDLNLSSAMALPPAAGNNRMMSSLVRNINGLPPHMQSNRVTSSSLQSVSSLASLSVDDARARQKTLQGKPHRGGEGGGRGGDGQQRYEQENEISTYEDGRRRQRHGGGGGSRDRRRQRDGGGGGSSVQGSQLSLNSLEESGGHRGGEKHNRSRHHQRSSSTTERQNAKNEQRSKGGGGGGGGHRRRPTEDFGDDEEVFDQSPAVTPSKNRSRHHNRDHPVYENLKESASGKDRESGRRSRKDRRRHEQPEEEEEGNVEQSIVPYGSRGNNIFRENEGVKVHTIPGKPSLIEVQYDRGPITIAVDTQANDFDALPPYNPTIGDSDGEFSWGDEETLEDEEEEVRVAGKKKSKHATERKDSRENELEERSRKRGSKHKKEATNIYANQREMLEEIKRKQHQEELLRQRKSLEEKELRTREEAERRREEQQEAERKARKEEEKARKRAKKLERRKMRQEQFEQEQEFEGMPTEEEPPERPYIMELPEDVENASFDSDSFEAEQESSRARLILSTQRRLSETTESLKKRWSHDEEEDEDIIQKENEAQLKAPWEERESPVPAKRPVKPPRPSVSQNSLDLDEAEVGLTPGVDADAEARVVIVEAKEAAPTEVKGAKEAAPTEVKGAKEAAPTEVKGGKVAAPTEVKGDNRVQGQEKPNEAVVSRYETFQAQIKETSKVELIRMETLLPHAAKHDDRDRKKNLDDELVEYDKEPRIVTPPPPRSSSSTDVVIRPGLNMRVTGEVPKAYTHKEKSSARRAFMLAAPVGIESSSEASDSELGGSRTSLTSRSPVPDKASAQRHHYKEYEESPTKSHHGSNRGSRENLLDSDAMEPRNAKSSDPVKLIERYAKPYESFGKIETKTDALEAAILEAQQKALEEEEEQRSEVDDVSFDLSRNERFHGNELSTFSPTASTRVNADLDAPTRDRNAARNRAVVHGQSSLQDTHLPTIQSTGTKVSNQFRNVNDVHLNKDSTVAAAPDRTSTVQTLAIPVASHVKETDIVSTETDDEYFDDDSFDDISDADALEEATVSVFGESSKDESHQNLSQSGEGLSMATEVSPSEVVSRPDDLPQVTQDLGNKQAEKVVHAFKNNLETYDQEPGARRPKPRTEALPAAKAVDRDPPAESSIAKKDLDSEVSAPLQVRQPEDEEVARINSKIGKKSGGKKTKSTKKKSASDDVGLQASTSDRVKVGGEDSERKAKKKKSKTKKAKAEVALSPATDAVTWKEAMEGSPLASSEMVETASDSKEHFTRLNLQNERRHRILAGSDESLSETPARKKPTGGSKQHRLPKNAALVSELRNNLQFKQNGDQLEDFSMEEIPVSNSLDIKIPPIGSRWNDQSAEDSALDVNIPPFDAKYYQINGTEDSAKWRLVPGGTSPAKQTLLPSYVNLDDIIIPRPTDGDESFSPGRETKQETERIVGRRQERLSKQGVLKHKMIKEMKERVTDLDDLSSSEGESSRRRESEIGERGFPVQDPRKNGQDKKQDREIYADDDTMSRSTDVKTLDKSFNEDIDILPPDATTAPGISMPKATPASKVVKPPKPMKPTYLTATIPAARKEGVRPLPTVSNSFDPDKFQVVSMAYTAGAEVVERPYRGEGIRYLTENSEPNRSSVRKILPRYPPGSVDDSRIGVASSDTEFGREQRLGRHGRLGPVHSEAEASDLETPVAPGPGKSYRQAALETINRQPRHPTFVLRQPGHHDKSFAHIRKLYKPQTRHSVTRHLVPSAGRYGDSELLRIARRSGTESEGDTDYNEYSYSHARQGSTAAGRGRGKVVTIRDGGHQVRGRPGPRRDEAPRITEPGPVDFSKFDVTARLWMEQVDRKTVLKSQTMYLSVLPEGQELPDEIIRRAKYQSALAGDASTVPLQWVMARSRAIAHKTRAAGEPRSDCGNTSGYDSDVNLFRPSTPGGGGRQLILFFKVGSNWLDLAWVLFDGLQTDSDTVRMIKDIQLKNPDRLTDQVHDLMHRWWRKKGAEATIEELQRALDTIHLAYIHEEYFDQMTAGFVPHEDDLDVGEVSDADPNVSRLVHEYDVRSLNASFVADSGGQAHEVHPETVLRQLQKAKAVAPGSTVLYTRASRTSRAESRDSSFERPTNNRQGEEKQLNESSGDDNRKQSPSNSILQKLKKNFKHETNL